MVKHSALWIWPQWIWGSLYLVAEKIQWKTKLQGRSGFTYKETHSTDRVWAISEGRSSLRLQSFDNLMQRTDSLEKPLMLGKIEGRGEGDNRGWDGWMASPTQWTWVWVNSGSWWWTGRPGMLPSMESQRIRHDWVTKLNWAEWVAGSFKLFWGRDRGFQELGHQPRFDLWLLELSWCLWVVMYLADVLQWAYTQVQGLVDSTCLLSWTHLVLIRLFCVPEPYNSFKGCALSSGLPRWH